MAKENLKTNTVEAPTLFVGVGGTGSRIVKRVAEMCKPGETENINFLCLDTNVNDLLNVTSSGPHIYFVQTSNTQTVGNYLDYDQDALKNWFPKNAVLYDKTVSEGAGQVRAISRLALNSTIKTGKIRPLYDSIDELFRKTGKAMKQAMRCCIVSTASGGTGSGILMPLAMFIRDYVRNKYPNTSLVVRSLVLLPETLDSVIDSSRERESQRRNAYATVKEINAFMMKGSGIFENDERLRRYEGLCVDFPDVTSNELKSLSLLPFDFCFLMDGQNAEDSTLISTNQYEVQAAQALYEQNIGPMQQKAFSVEDNIIKEMSDKDKCGRNRFGGIGAGVIRYPYEDVVKYIGYNWAIDSIGGEGEAAKWSKYDKAYEVKFKEAKKKGLASTETVKRSEVYTSMMDTAEDPFTKDLRNTFLKDAEDRIAQYFDALVEQMHESLNNNTEISNARGDASALENRIDYDNANNRGKAKKNLERLRTYESVINRFAQKAAASTAEAMFLSGSRTINEKKPYTLEALMKNSFGEICHPNAARYMLYKVKEELDKRVETATSDISDWIDHLRRYSKDANLPDMFDAAVTPRKEKREKNLDELCDVEKKGDDEPSIFEKLGGYSKIYDTLNACFPDYYNTITDLGNTIAELEAYQLGSEYVGELCEMYERFYYTFAEKVSALIRRQDDLVDALRFTKGDSTLNICAERELMDELSGSTRSVRDEGNMLTKELNGKIFDAVKDNVVFERENRYSDVIEEDRRVDIFDDILLEYFCDSVRDNCDNINMNIVEAIAMEKRLKARIKLRAEQENGKNEKNGKNENVFDKVSLDEIKRYIAEKIAVGERLSAPGIQRITNEEAREIKLCAYNKSLLDMRAYRITDLIPKGEAVDTISRYELHFFNALYNLTPDKLNKFASPLKTETGAKNAGLYHNAYMAYAKNLGPDSTKSMLISTHIDKRWDSIAVMPELDFDFQDRMILKIHKAMIYGLIHEAIHYSNLSVCSGGKMVYRYQDSQERETEMIVTNGTLCDEFYEILDSLYISPFIVEDIEAIKTKKRSRDRNRNSDYYDTRFYKDLQELHIPNLHEGPTSLFEIPLAYFNSLPNSKRYVSEIKSMVNAVVAVFEEELSIWEKPEDAKFILCSVLKDQFDLLMKNFNECEALNQGLKASEHLVISLVFRKISSILGTTPEPDDFESTVQQMRDQIG